MSRPKDGISLAGLVEWLRRNGKRNVEVATGYTLDELIRDLDKIEKRAEDYGEYDD